MAYYSNTGAEIHSGAAGLGVMATLVQGPDQKMESGAAREITSMYAPPKKIDRSKLKYKVIFKLDVLQASRMDRVKFRRAVQRRGGEVVSLPDWNWYGTMHYPSRLNLGFQKFDGVNVQILSVDPLPQSTKGVGHYGELMSYRDGVLGGVGAGPLQAFKDGSLGMSGSGPLMSYKDGSLGMPLFLETAEGSQLLDEPVVIRHGHPDGESRLRAYRDGSLGEYFSNGMGEYFTGMAGTGCSSCGQVPANAPATMPVLNLSDPEAMMELKTAMAAAPWLLVNMQNAADQLEADIRDPKWTSFSTQLAEAWMQGYGPYMVAMLQGNTQAASAAEYAAAAQQGFVPPEQIPNILGVQAIYSILQQIFMGEDGQGKNAMFTAAQFPKLVSFMAAVQATGGQGEVSYSGGGSPFAQANMMTIGIGALAIAGLVYLAMGKKKR